jgi:hypothetical protein
LWLKSVARCDGLGATPNTPTLKAEQLDTIETSQTRRFKIRVICMSQ